MDKYEIMFATIETIIAVIGLVLIVFGWIVPSQQEKKKITLQKEQEINIERIKWRKEQIDAQISNLYGPIYALIIEGNVTFSRILYQLGRNYVFTKDISFEEMPLEEQAIWSHYVDEYKIPSQNKIASILRENIHLIYNSEIPTCYKLFLDYALGWELLDNQKRHSVPNFYEYHYCFNYPHEFDTYIKDTLELLLEEQAQLLKSAKKADDNLPIDQRKINVHTSGETIYEPDEEVYIISSQNKEGQEFPKLVSVSTKKVIYINKPIFYIGRDKNLSDLYLRNYLINYKHAYIVTKNGACFLIDTGSINGTYINGHKVSPKSESLLKNNDNIAFSNEEFIFTYYEQPEVPE